MKKSKLKTPAFGKHVRSRSAMRVKGLIRKEFLQIVRDPSSLAIAFILPVVLLVIHGYGVSLDPKDISLAVVVQESDNNVSSLVSAFEGSPYFSVKRYASMPYAVDAIRSHEVKGILRIRDDFSEALNGTRTAPVQLILNGVDANTARIVSGYSEGIFNGWLRRYAQQNGAAPSVPVNMDYRVWFNSEMRSRNFLVPGLIAVNMTLIGALLTAMVMAREWERGTMESLMATPVSMSEILLGKLIPYFLLGMGGLLLSVAMAVWLFDVPLRGSFWIMLLTATVFLAVALGMGLLISILARSQFVAGQIAIIVTFLPAFLLSGYVFDIRSMPQAVQVITHVVAARYFIAVLQSLFLAGDIWSVIWKNLLALTLMGFFFIGLCFIKSKKRLD